MKVNGRTFVVSGGASGLGLAAVKDLLAGDAYVSILDKSISRQAIEPSPRLLLLEVDITDLAALEDAVEKTASWARDQNAPLGGVVHCAGIGIPFLTTGKDAVALFDKTMAVNIGGTFHLTRLVAKHLIRASPPPASDSADEDRGVIIMLSSTVAHEGHVGQVAYAGTKGAIRSMTLPLARELARYRLRVVTITPGLFTTPMTGQFQGNTRQFLMDNAVLYPKRFGKPEEFARTVRWVLECSYVNGESIKLTGGARVPVKL